MTKTTPQPREWYLHTSNNSKGDLFYNIAGPEPRMLNDTQYESPVRVIEYSAIEQLQAELAKANEQFWEANKAFHELKEMLAHERAERAKDREVIERLKEYEFMYKELCK
jgi:hypothetical protein